MSKVTIKLQGGIGNMLFEIATAYSYAKRTGKELFLTTYSSSFGHRHTDVYKNNILRNIKISNNPIDYNGFKVYTESPNFLYQEIPNVEGDIYLQHYFQSEKYFNSKEEIQNLFSFPQELIDKIKYKYPILNSDKNTCSMHFRRGDYLNHPDYHPTQTMSYYSKAMKQMPSDTTFLIFSDDIPYCKQQFPNDSDKFIFVEGNEDYEDLLAMSLCTNNIIANSSFSWFGAYLNKNEKNNIVVSPKNWFGFSANLNPQDIYCKDWIII